jgi:hypothetical protein
MTLATGKNFNKVYPVAGIVPSEPARLSNDVPRLEFAETVTPRG